MYLRNKTSHYSSAGFAIHQANPNSFASQSKGVYDLYVRVQSEYNNTISNGGKVFFYTLTFNNKSLHHCNSNDLLSIDFNSSVKLLPHHDEFDRLVWHNFAIFSSAFSNIQPIHSDIPTLDFTSFRYFYNGGFRKKLLRNFNCSFKYIAFSEYGDGKGKRGFGFNPHFHVLFFVTPLKGKTISAYDFRSLVREYWQGDFKNKRDYIFGIARESKYNLGEVTSFHAFNYCVKYVIKDEVTLNAFKSFHAFYINAIKHIFSTCSNIYSVYKLAHKHTSFDDFCYLTAQSFYKLYAKHSLSYKFLSHLSCSKNFGACGINLFRDSFLISLPFNGVPKEFYLPKYLYRKYLTISVHLGGSTYELPNSRGLEYKVFKFRERYNDMYHSIYSLLDFVTNSSIDYFIDLNEQYRFFPPHIVRNSFNDFHNVVKSFDKVTLSRYLSLHSLLFSKVYFSSPVVLTSKDYDNFLLSDFMPLTEFYSIPNEYDKPYIPASFLGYSHILFELLILSDFEQKDVDKRSIFNNKRLLKRNLYATF